MVVGVAHAAVHPGVRWVETGCAALPAFLPFCQLLPQNSHPPPTHRMLLINTLTHGATCTRRLSPAPTPSPHAPTPPHSASLPRPSCFRFPRGSGVGIDLAAEGITPDFKGVPLEVRWWCGCCSGMCRGVSWRVAEPSGRGSGGALGPGVRPGKQCEQCSRCLCQQLGDCQLT